MKPPAFEYERPASLRAALETLSRHSAKAKLLAGGHSLIPLLNLRQLAPDRLIDVSRLAELQYIHDEAGQLRIGALTSHNTIMRSPAVAAHCPLMAEAYQHVANHCIRNRGTLGGNLCHNDPAFEMPLVVTLLGASMVARNARSSRTIPADRFFKAPFATDLAGDEMLVEVRIPRMTPGHGHAFLEVSQRFGDRALVAVACLLTVRYGVCRDVRIGVRDAVHNVFRIAGAEAKLEGKPASAAAIDAAAAAVASGIAPANDLHADEAYRRDVAETLTRRAPGTRFRIDRPTGVRAQMSEVEVNVVVNGRPFRRRIEPRLLLSDFIRQQIGLTGTHVGCESGVCGACTILLDGLATRACCTLAVQADGRRVETVESLGRANNLGPLQRAFWQMHGLQCGYCTPGMLMLMTELLRENPQPDRETIRLRLNDNICRCTGYEDIVNSVERAVELMRSEPAVR